MPLATYKKFGRIVNDSYKGLRVRILLQDIKGAPCVVKLEPGFYVPLGSRSGRSGRRNPKAKLTR